ncbi:MAG TPA: PVC-type heme-binding CxxCH protein [Pirellulaceae bacterium]|jgi:putative membrane-bound dehydrogenase-like protein|nr:PVC-type heme-binding CxxCH protein [Pirellulaceae bacterium]
MSSRLHQLSAFVVSAAALAIAPFVGPVSGQEGTLPKGADGKSLNLDFETGTLEDWKAEGDAFEGQPIEGDTVKKRRGDMTSRHQGKFWIGSYERKFDLPRGTLTSAPFEVTQPFVSFLFAGGVHAETRVELVRESDGEVIYRTSGVDREDLRRFVVDLQKERGKRIFIRLVDDHSGGWGHVNFDDFRLHAKAPAPPTQPSAPLARDEYPLGGVTAEVAAAAMKVPPGFSVRVGAAEPDVQQPIAMAIDDRGRIWIAEAYEYPVRAKEGQGRDRILIFEDTNGDGSLDSRKIFAEGLNLVSGLEVGHGGVWVGAAPYLLFIADADRDDVPDAEPQILLDGWGYEDTHETLNSFIWGPDGWLYGCHGVFTYSRVGKSGAPDVERVPLNAGVWRYHPTRQVFEVFAHGTSNPWGVDFDDRGEAFITACVIPHLYHMIQGGRYQRQAGPHFNPYTYDDIKTIADHLHYLGANPHGGNDKSDAAGGGHAHAGAMIYLGGKWPAEHHGALFMNNIHGQRLNVDRLSEQGSGYVGTHGPDFLLTGDRASQILNFRYGPDGDVWFIDWYDMQACHHGNASVHDRSNGRIYKIVYEGDATETPGAGRASLAKLGGDLSKVDDETLALLTLDANDWFVRHARRVLFERAKTRVIEQKALERLVDIATNHPDETRRLRAMWAIHACAGEEDRQLLEKATSDPSPFVRAWAIRLKCEIPAGIDDATVALLTRLAREDESPVVRLQVASALNRVPPAQRWQAVEALASHAEDAGDHNLPLMIWYAAEPLAEVDPERALALGISAGETMPKLRDFMLRRIGSGDPDASLALLVKGLGKANDPALQRTFVSAIRAALQGRRNVQPPADWAAAYGNLRGSPDESLQLQSHAIAAILGDAKATESLRILAANEKASAAIRSSAIEASLTVRDEKIVPVLYSLLEGGSPPELRRVALRGLAQFDSEDTPARVLGVLETLPPEARQSALATLASRPAWGRQLLQAVAAGEFPASSLSSDLVRQLQLHGDLEIDGLLKQTWGSVRATPEEKAKLIAEYAGLVKRSDLPPADLEHGRAIFAQTCQRCHVLYGAGGKVGPDLTGSNRANLEYLLSNIIDPSAVMAKEYQQTSLILADGRVLVGIVKAEDARTVTLQTADAAIVVPVADIEERIASPTSLMPEDQLRPFDERAIRSLIAYLSSPRQNPMLADAQNVQSFFDGQTLTGWSGDPSLWSVENGEIVGKSDGLARNEFLISDIAAEDFRVSLEVKLAGDVGNSGVQFRSEPIAGGEMRGYQADIGPGWWGKLYEEHGRGLLWEKSGEAHVKKGEWNRYEIVAEGDRVRTYLNGELCVDLQDPAGKRRGVFALQLHSGGPTEVRFRNLTLEILGEKTKPHADAAAGK